MKVIKVKNLLLINTLKFITIPIAGYILLNLLFLFYALIVNGYYEVFNIERRSSPLILMIVISAFIFIGLYFVLRSKASKVIKSILLCIPLSIIYLLIGILLYKYVIIVDLLGLLVFLIVSGYLYIKKASWELYWGVIWISILMLIMSILRIDI